MKTQPTCPVPLREKLGSLSDCSGRFLQDAATGVSLADLPRGTSLGGRLQELQGRSVLVAARDQLATALALIELDGVAGRLVICPPDIHAQYLPSVMGQCAVNAIVSDHDTDGGPGDILRVA